VLHKTAVVCVFSETGRRGKGRMPLASAAKRLKRLKTAMGGCWKKLAWIWVWRHSRLGLAPRRLGIDGDHANSQRDKSRNLGAYSVSYWPKGRGAIDA
jgi:hypothetical protein